MCGLAGVMIGDPRRHEPRQLAESMQSKLLHRGPDDRGLFIAKNQACALAQTRLAILDLSTAGHQPMSTPDRRYTIALNGEIYNFRELRRELEQAGCAFASRTDTEVVLQLFARYGLNCLDRLSGMFALCVWDEESRRLIVARDRFGIKPIYYYATRDAFLCASEVRALQANSLIPRKLCLNGLAEYLQFGSVQDPFTLVEGVRALLPGHFLSIERVGGEIRLTETAYAKDLAVHAAAGQNVRRQDALVELRQILEDSVRRHLVSDVPLGVFLSGGIDSTAIVALLKQVRNEPVKTFTVVFGESEFSEAKHARIVAQRFSTDHREIPLSEDHLRALIPAALAAMDQPTMDGINSYVIAKAVRESGVTVALSGLGGDELFAGYPSFRRAVRLEKLAWFARGLRKKAAALGTASFGGSPRQRKFWRLLESDASPHAVYRISRELFAAEEIKTLMPGTELGRYRASANGAHDAVNAVSSYELRGYLANTLLRDTDQMSMAYGLEVRVPFIDAAVVDHVLSLPGAWKLDNLRPKPLLLAALGDLIPKAIWRRPKMGFTLPFQRWMLSTLRHELDSSLGHDQALRRLGIPANYAQSVWRAFAHNPRRETWSRPWALYVLDRWCELNGIGS